MKATVAATRRDNLRRLVDRHGGVAELARKLEYASSSYLSQLLTTKRAIGEKTARSIEEKLGLRRGWLDVSKEEQDEFDSLVAAVITAAGDELEREQVQLEPKRFARLVAEVYNRSVHAGELDLAYLKRLVSLLK